MTSRRSFLKLIGVAPIAAPALPHLIEQAAASLPGPVQGVSLLTGHPSSCWPLYEIGMVSGVPRIVIRSSLIADGCITAANVLRGRASLSDRGARA